MQDLQPGRVLNGKYRVERVLGKGGMGFVIEAFHLELECKVAVKLLHAELRTNQELVDRFLREGKCAARITNEHVAKVFDVGRLEDGTPYLVMEYLVGHDLAGVRKSRTPLPRAEAIEFLLQACSAISEAHAQGIIHRDIKPANLFLTRSRTGKPTIKLLDFGISKISSADPLSEVSSTKSSVVMGSAEYMSPEQMLSTRDADHRTDIWALGVVLFELLTAQVPFSGETLTQICMKLMSQPAPRLTVVRPDLDADLDRVIQRCLEKDRDKRYATVDELAAALEACRAAPAKAAAVEPRTAPQPVTSLPAHAYTAPQALAPVAAQALPTPGTEVWPHTGSGHLSGSSPGFGPPRAAAPQPLAHARVSSTDPAMAGTGHASSAAPVAVPASVVAAPSTNPAWAGTSAGAPSPAPRSSRAPLFVALGMLAAVGATVGIVRPWEPRRAPATNAPTSAVASTASTTSTTSTTSNETDDTRVATAPPVGDPPATPPPPEPQSVGSSEPAPSPSGEGSSLAATPRPVTDTGANPASKPLPPPSGHPAHPTNPPITAATTVTPTASSKTPRTMY